MWEYPHCSSDNRLCLQPQIPTGTAIYVDLALESSLGMILLWGRDSPTEELCPGFCITLP